ncbi:unnamed protein product [Aphanomyces euteiches]|nr:hypothetical protein Ae201684P_018729 [Aphanomyces euteiches]KAH9134592.1 hypothetical protein AeRB84_019691 [Aphanomyces euteiches]
MVGLPEKPISFADFSVAPRQIAGWYIGSPAQLEEKVAFAVEKNVNSIVEVMRMSKADDVRFRIVLKKTFNSRKLINTRLTVASFSILVPSVVLLDYVDQE